MMIAWKPDGSAIYSGRGGSVSSKYATLMIGSGLKDKNGKEIFEGDILRPAEGVDNCKTGSNFVVRWNPEKAHFECIRGQIAILTDNWHMREIIGNMYENAELLK